MDKTTKAAIETAKSEQRITISGEWVTINHDRKERIILTNCEATCLIQSLVDVIADTQFRSCEIEM